jgi:hypothetical protein
MSYTGRIKKNENEAVNHRLNFPFLGRIKCGEKIKNASGKEFPVSRPYFIASGKYAELFNQAYGEKCNQIQIVFMENDPSLVCDERLEMRDSKGRLIAFGDGMTFSVYNEKSQLYDEFSVKLYPDIMERLSSKWQAKWDAILKLRVLVPKISGVVGYWEIATKGIASSIPEITSVFDNMLANNGFVKGIIFDLNVEIHKSNKPNDSRQYPVLSIVPNHSPKNLEIIKKHFSIGHFNQIENNDT